MKSLLGVREPALSDEDYVVGSAAIKPKFEFNFAWLISPVPMPRPKWRAVADKQEERPFGRPCCNPQWIGNYSPAASRGAGSAFCRGDLHVAVVVDIDLGAGLLDDFTDHLAAGADHFADLVGGNLEGLDARRVFAEFGARGVQGLGHFAENMDAPFLGLAERDPHDLLGDPGDLDVHLQRGDAVIGAGHLEVHVAEMILVTEDVRQNGKARTLQDEAHGDARGRPL